MNEVWTQLKYHGDYYQNFEVSNKGNLRNIITGTVYKQTVNHQGYYSVCVSVGSRNNKKLFKIHRCVAESFIPNLDNKPQINHIDGNKLNNNVENLEWVTAQENSQHAYRTGLASGVKGEKNPCAKLTNEQVKYIRNNYIKNDNKFGCHGLARMFNVDRHTVLDIINYKSYKDVS